jgi:hypothetical protein
MGAVITTAVKYLDDDKKPQKRPVIPGEVEKTIALGMCCLLPVSLSLN